MIEDAALRRRAAAMLQRGRLPTSVAHALDLDPQAVQKLRRRLGLAPLPRGRPPGAYGPYRRVKVALAEGVPEPLRDGLNFTVEEVRRLDAWLDAHVPSWRQELARFGAAWR
jgi:hypothetical protein